MTDRKGAEQNKMKQKWKKKQTKKEKQTKNVVPKRNQDLDLLDKAYWQSSMVQPMQYSACKIIMSWRNRKKKTNQKEENPKDM